jgi:SPP1 family predicted phage head-tail adaptor
VLSAGRLDKRVELQAPARTRNSLGESVATWATTATVWASIEPLSGRELIAAQQVQSEVSAVVRIRYRAGVTPSMRVKHGTTHYSVVAIVNPHEGSEQLQLMCRQGVRDE